MKKLLAILLSVIIVFTVATPAFAEFGTGKWLTTKVPMIVLAGDGNKLVYDNETKAFDINDMLSIYKNSEDGSFKEAAFNILYPLILKGIAFDDWDDYYDAVYKEISDVYKPIMLDENGNVTNDSGISTAQKQDMQSCMTWSRANPDGSFNEETYEFFYDWRLDPCQVADQLHEYIEGVKRATGCSKVELASRCLGSNIVLAYISKYGSASVKGLGIDVSTTNGANFLGGMLSGEFGVDGSGLSRIATDLIYADEDYKAYREDRKSVV